MRRTVTIAVVLVFLLAAFGGGAAAQEDGQLSEHEIFVSMAFSAGRPASGRDLYESIHEYMWKSVYVMGTVDYMLPADEEDGQFVFIRTWEGEGHRSAPPDSDFVYDDSLAIQYDGIQIVGDAIVHLPPGVEFPGFDFELVGSVCGVQKFHADSEIGAAFPIICIAADGLVRIRELPVYISWVDE